MGEGVPMGGVLRGKLPEDVGGMGGLAVTNDDFTIASRSSMMRMRRHTQVHAQATHR